MVAVAVESAGNVAVILAEVDAVWAVAVAGVEAPLEVEEPIVPGLA